MSALAQGRRFLALGDSHTAGSGSTIASRDSYSSVAARSAGTEAASVIRAGYAGYRSDQLLELLPSLLDTHDPGGMSVLQGTNDSGAGVTPATFIANVRAQKAIAIARGIPFVLVNVPPCGAAATSAATRMALVDSYNHALYSLAVEDGVEMVDIYSLLVDPETGYAQAGYVAADGTNVHFNDAGHAVIGEALAPSIVQGVRLAPWPIMARGFDLLPNPLNDPVLGGWSAIAGIPDPSSGYSDRVDGDGLTAGSWFHLDKDNTGGGSAVSVIRAQNIDMTDVDEGDVLALFSRFYITGDATLTLRVIRGTSSISLPVDGATHTPLSGFVGTYTVQAADIGQTLRWGFSISVAAGESGTGGVGQHGVRNLTKRGLIGTY